MLFLVRRAIQNFLKTNYELQWIEGNNLLAENGVDWLGLNKNPLFSAPLSSWLEPSSPADSSSPEPSSLPGPSWNQNHCREPSSPSTWNTHTAKEKIARTQKSKLGKHSHWTPKHYPPTFTNYVHYINTQRKSSDFLTRTQTPIPREISTQELYNHKCPNQK